MQAQERWSTVWGEAASSAAEPEYNALVAAYNEPHRAYHTFDHVLSCLREFDLVRSESLNPTAVELAIWFHDVVYRPLSSRNEENSAVWAKRSLENGSAAAALVESVYELVFATSHTALPKGIDQQLLIDIDLSILGAEPSRYREYEEQVRTEYRVVPGFIFRKRRAELLAAFLGRPHIFNTVHFRSRYEQQARENLGSAIESLERHA